jgi:hypothetical protein
LERHTGYQALCHHGVKAEYFHPTDDRTLYPRLDRDKAVQEWLSRHLEVCEDYLCLDDVLCAEPDHMVLVDPDAGLHYGHLVDVITRFGGTPDIVLL